MDSIENLLQVYLQEPLDLTPNPALAEAFGNPLRHKMRLSCDRPSCYVPLDLATPEWREARGKKPKGDVLVLYTHLARPLDPHEPAPRMRGLLEGVPANPCYWYALVLNIAAVVYGKPVARLQLQQLGHHATYEPKVNPRVARLILEELAARRRAPEPAPDPITVKPPVDLTLF